MGDKSKDRYNSILEIIDKRLIPDEEAKKARGEVFTPLDLVRQMLYGIKKTAMEKEKKCVIWGFDEAKGFFDDDEDDRLGGIPLHVFRDSNSTWLDPANGIGNFPVVAFYMLDYQLGKHAKQANLKGDSNKEKRRKHIVEKMLFMIELNKGNVNTSRKIFKMISPSANSNICCANTLAMTNDKLQTVFGVTQFDVVMGNPPFNESLEKNPKGHAQDTGLWEKFVQKSLNEFVKKTDGFLAFLHPARWRQPEHSLHKLMFSKHFLYLAIFNKKEGEKMFNAITRFDFYILQNKNTHTTTFIKFDDNTVMNVSITVDTPFIPNFGYNIWEKIISSKHEPLKVEGGGSQIKYTSSDRASNDKCNVSKPYLNVNTTSKTSRVPPGAKYTKTRKNSDSSSIYIDVVCSANKHPLADKKKVIFSKNEVIYSFYDSGKYGLTSNAFCILVDNNDDGLTIVKYLNSNLLKYLIASVKFGNYSTAKDIFKFIPSPLFIKSSYTHDKIYRHYMLTPSDIKQVNGSYINEEENINDKKDGGSRFQTTRKTKRT